MMKKGKGYPEHIKPSGKSFGNAYDKDISGDRSSRAVLNEWPDYAWKMPEKGSK